MSLTNVKYTIKELDCASEEQLLRAKLTPILEVKDIATNYMSRTLTVSHSLPDSTRITDAVRSTGLTIVSSSDEAIKSAGVMAQTPIISKTAILLLGLSGICAILAETFSLMGEKDNFTLVVGLSFISILSGGRETLKKGYLAAKAFTLNINFLMTIAVVGAAIIGEWPEAAMVIFLFSVAELIEKYSLEKARNAVRSLMSLTPEEASVMENGKWTVRKVAEVSVGTLVRVKPGERIPLDGVVESGNSSVNQAPITGESMPVEKGPGSKVFAGTINENGLLEFKTSGGKDDTTLSRIIRAVQDAEGERAPTQRFVDSFSRVYTPIIVVLAFLIAFIPPIFFSGLLSFWAYKALVLLVIACPCALVISTPVTVVSGLASAAKKGILIKGGVYLEGGKELRTVALDKTGTLTEGKPKVTDTTAFNELPADEVLKLAASVNTHSDHPVARAITEAWKKDLFQVENFNSLTGRGAEAKYKGETLIVGSHRLAEERGVCGPHVEEVLEKLEKEGKTTVVVAHGSKTLGVIGVADTPRESSIAAVKELHTLGIKTLMLSGDNQKTAEAIAKIVGIDEAKGGLLPEDKLKIISELQATGNIGMVGDGVNDAPALAKANIGFAMGAAGTDTALETADVALMMDDLRGLPEFIKLSKKTGTVLKQNIWLAIGSKAVFFVLGVMGVATMWMAVVADMGASLLVTLNGLRLGKND